MRPPQTIKISDLFRDIADGVGIAAKKTFDASQTEIGALAAKSADIRVEFAMTSRSASSKDTAGAELGAFTLNFVTSAGRQETSVTNRADVRLSFVSVQPAVEIDPPAALPPKAKPAPQPAKDPKAERAAILKALEELRELFKRLPGSDQDKKKLAAELVEVEQTLRQHGPAAAKAALERLGAKYAEIEKPSKGSGGA